MKEKFFLRHIRSLSSPLFKQDRIQHSLVLVCEYTSIIEWHTWLLRWNSQVHVMVPTLYQLTFTHIEATADCIATLPSMLPTAYPLPSGKQDTTRVCHFRGDSMTYVKLSSNPIRTSSYAYTVHFERSIQVENVYLPVTGGDHLYHVSNLSKARTSDSLAVCQRYP